MRVALWRRSPFDREFHLMKLPMAKDVAAAAAVICGGGGGGGGGSVC